MAKEAQNRPISAFERANIMKYCPQDQRGFFGKGDAMTSRAKAMRLVVLTSLFFGLGPVCFGDSMGTAFTYQGRLTSGGTPVNVAQDFEFRVFDAETGGNQVGSMVPMDDMGVTDGYFITTLDFGSGVFTGDARWLQIAVRPGTETGAYTTLAPRHELTPTPYTLYASFEGTANYIPKFTAGGMTSSILYESGGNVGIGTTGPSNKLHVVGTSAGATLEVVNAAASKFLNFDYSGGPASGGYGNFQIQPFTLVLQAGNFNGKIQLTPYNGGVYDNNLGLTLDTVGNVGIGATDPGTAKLYVAGEAAGVAPNIRTNGDVVLGFGGGIFFDGNHSYATGSYIKPIDAANNQGFFTAGQPRMKITNSGNIGVATTVPGYLLHVIGTIGCVNLVQTSDEQLKTEVQPLGGVLDKLDHIRAVSFRWNERAQALGVKTGAKQIGVLAQEVEQVFPELVSTPEPANADKLLQDCPKEMLTPEVRQRLAADAEKTRYKAVNYGELTAVLLEAVRELKSENDSLKDQLKRLDALEARVKQLEAR